MGRDGGREEVVPDAVAPAVRFAVQETAPSQTSAMERSRVEAVAETERRLSQNLMEALPGIFYLYDEQGRFLRWNREFERISGYSGAEIAHMHPLQFFADEEKELLARRIAEVFASGQASVEASFVTKHGAAIPYFFTGRRVELDGATCLIGVGVDVAERKRAQEAARRSEERYRSTLDSTLEGCQILDFDWRYLYLNGAAATQNRRSNAELLGQRMPDAWPGIESTAVFALLARCMRERVPCHQETEFVFADGSSGWFDVRAQPVPEGIFVLSIDISERKRAERALRELNENLELKVRERTLELESARERAESADRLKSTFLATMSHELRTPLNSILGFTSIILQGMAGPLTSEQAKQLAMVQSSAQHLLALINDVLDISKIEAGQLEVSPAPFDILAVVEHVTELVRPQVDKKGLALRVIAPPAVPTMESDRRRVEQVLLNLVNNAIKFTDRGEIRVTLDELPEIEADGARVPGVRIQVSDTGIGLRQEDLAKLFRPFQQIDAGLRRQHEGTGLGLAICRRLVGLLRGKIDVESTWGAGSTFTVALPLKWRAKS